MAGARTLGELVGKQTSIVLNGTASTYLIVALDIQCRFVKLVSREVEEPVATWYPLDAIESIEEPQN